MAVKRTCMLKPIEVEYCSIPLKTFGNIIGRSKATGIRDLRCSKRQLELNVNCDNCRVKLKVLGVNPCSVNGLMIMQNKECELEHGDVLEMVYGRHPFKLFFIPPPPNDKFQEEYPRKQQHLEQEKESWDSVDNGKMIVYTSSKVCPSSKIAGYDIDGTIIKTRSGNVFPKNSNDWQLNYPEKVTNKLKTLFENGYKICFFTNQGGIAKGKVNLNEFKDKVRQIVQKLSLPIQVFIAVTDSYYRKPLPGMWEYLQKEKNGGIELELEKCFYVGDAAGRPEVGSGNSKRKKDHSLADRLFAKNINIAFYTPEEHFLNYRIEEWTKPDFDPTIHLQYNLPQLEPETTKLPADECEIIIMVGLPGSGKSQFSNSYLKRFGYIVVNADTLGSVKACLKTCENALIAGSSCVIDNTNVDYESRKKFIDLAAKHHVACRCFEMNVHHAQIRHNIAFRELTASHAKINDMIFNSMKKKFKSPTLDEGFKEIIKVNFNPKFNSAEEERLYKLHLVEK